MCKYADVLKIIDRDFLDIKAFAYLHIHASAHH